MNQALAQALAAEAQARSLSEQTLKTGMATATSAGPAAWRMFRDFGVFKLNATAAGTYLLLPGGTIAAAGAAGSATAAFYMNDLYPAVTGLTTYLRLTTFMMMNPAVAPGVNFTTSIKLAGSLSGTSGTDPGIGVGADGNTGAISTVHTSPTGKDIKTSTSASVDVTFPTNRTWFVPQLVISGAMAAGSYADLFVYLEVHNA